MLLARFAVGSKRIMEMGTNYTDIAQDIMARLERMERRDKEIFRLVNAIYHDEDLPDETIKTQRDLSQFEKIPYLLLERKYDEEIKKFREFLHYVKTNEAIFNEFERESADIADKRFDDVRISKKSSTILFGIYKKAYNETWKFPFKNTYLYINRTTNERLWADEVE
jgi:hypothetical protein